MIPNMTSCSFTSKTPARGIRSFYPIISSHFCLCCQSPSRFYLLLNGVQEEHSHINEDEWVKMYPVPSKSPTREFLLEYLSWARTDHPSTRWNKKLEKCPSAAVKHKFPLHPASQINYFKIVPAIIVCIIIINILFLSLLLQILFYLCCYCIYYTIQYKFRNISQIN